MTEMIQQKIGSDSDNGKALTERTEKPQVRHTDLCEQTASGSFDQKDLDLGEAVLWKEATDISASIEPKMKESGRLDREKERKQGINMTQK